MTGYYVRWNIAPNEASKLDMYVGSVQFDGKLLPESERDQVSGGTLTFDASDTILSNADAGISVGCGVLPESASFDDAVSPAAGNLATVAAEDATASGDLSAIDIYKTLWLPSRVGASGGAPLASESSDDASSAEIDNLDPKHGTRSEEIETLDASYHEPSSSHLVSAAHDADREPSLTAASTWSLEPSSEPAPEPAFKLRTEAAFKSLSEADSSSTWPFEPSIEPASTAPSEASAEPEQSPESAAPTEHPNDQADVVGAVATLSYPSNDIESLAPELADDTASSARDNLATVAAADATASANILAFDISEAILAAAEVAANGSAPLVSESSDDASSAAIDDFEAKHGAHSEEIETLDESVTASHDEPDIVAAAHAEHVNHAAAEDAVEPVSNAITARGDMPVSSAVHSAFEPFIEPSLEWSMAGLSTETSRESAHEPSSSQLVNTVADADREPSLKTASTWAVVPSSESAMEPAFKSLPEANSSFAWPSEPSIEPTWTAPSDASAEPEQSLALAAPTAHPNDAADVADACSTLDLPSSEIAPLPPESADDAASSATDNLATVAATDTTASADIFAFDISEALLAAAEVAASDSAPRASELSDDASSDAFANIDAKHGAHIEEIETLGASLAASHDQADIVATAHAEQLNRAAAEDTVEPVSETTAAHGDIAVSSAVHSAFEPFIEPSFEWPMADLSSEAPEKPEHSPALAAAAEHPNDEADVVDAVDTLANPSNDIEPPTSEPVDETASLALDNLATVSAEAEAADATASRDITSFDITEAIAAAAEVAASGSAPLASELSDDANSDAFGNINAKHGAHAEEIEAFDASLAESHDEPGVDAAARAEHLNQAAAEDTIEPASETTTSLPTLGDAPVSSAVHSAFEPFIEPSFEWPMAALSTESSREPAHEPSSSQLVNAAPDADREPSLKAMSAWSLEPSSEPASEPVFKSLSEADSSFVWPSESSIEPTWAAPAEASAEPEQPLAVPTAHPNDEADAAKVVATFDDPSSEQITESRHSDDKPASQSHADAEWAQGFETPSESAHGPEQFHTPTESAHAREHASSSASEINASKDAPSTGIVPLTHSADFSDLIALAGPTLLDDDYHDHPSGRHASLPDLGRGTNGSGIPLTLDEGEEADPLAALTAEYKQTLLHRTRGSSHELKNVSTENAPIVAPPNDPFTDMLKRRDDGSLLEDLLGSSRNIDSVLESLDEFGAEQLFEADERHEILSLLAPGNARSQLFPQPAMLARQEHHLISVDSHIQMVNSTHYDEQESNQDETQR